MVGKTGYNFSVWCPGVKSVYVVGSFCNWEILDKNAMQPEKDGSWHLFVPDVKEYDQYKFYIEPRNGKPFYKADPKAMYAQTPPETASIVYYIDGFEWHDSDWVENRKKLDIFNVPMNIFEVHAGSWKRNPNGSYYTYKQLAKELIPYVKQMGYTHIELLPITEFPFDGSWGYQTTGYYAPTSRFGEPKDFMFFIDECHKQNVGVILDWVPGHFCKDSHGLYRFNGSELYEKYENSQWGTCIFDYGRPEVADFLRGSACHWIEKYHIDGIRVDGVSSMLYLNFGIEDNSKKRYNRFGEETNLEAIKFIKDLNSFIGSNYQGVVMIAEESTAFPLVTYPPEKGGLGFHYKWDMGWMNDTLRYMQTDFPYRSGNHNLLTFSMMYFYSENYVLALSHDEVVHGKCSLIQRMPGDYWRQFAGMRSLAFYQITHPGAKLSFMGNEIAQFVEWKYYEGIEYFLAKEFESHRVFQNYINKLNNIYLEEKSLWKKNNFKWIDADNNKQSTIIYSRDELVMLINFVPEVYDEYRIGVNGPGTYKEIFNTDNSQFGGSGRINKKKLKAEKIPMHGLPYSIVIKTPPIGGLILKKDEKKNVQK